MEVRCDKCQARYRVDDARIGPQGLTMRCGKCQNTFRVNRPAPAAAPEGKTPAQPAPERPQQTMIFAAPAAAPRPPPSAPAPAPEDTAGRTMMFPSAAPAPRNAPEPSAGGTVVFSQPAPRPAPAKAAALPQKPPAPNPAAEPGQSTMIFGGGPAAQKPPASKPPASKPPASRPPASGAGQSTLIFGASPTPQGMKTIPAMPPGPPAREPPPPAPAAAPPPAAMPAAQAGSPAIPAAEPQEAEASAEEEAPAAGPAREPGPFDQAPPRALLVGVAAGLLLLLAAGGALLLYRKLARHPPPPAAVEMLASADLDAAQDTLASIASAEAKARDSLELAGPRALFPEATAALARIEIQWADALEDEASRLLDKNADDPRAAQLQAQARAKAKSAFELLAPAAKSDRRSPELQLALADYYRAQRSPSNMNRWLKPFKDDARAALIEGMAAAQELDGAERAIPRLKAALAAEPRSARIHFRLALAFAALKDDAGARAELKETLRLSPRHERAQLLLEQLGTAGAAERK